MSSASCCAQQNKTVATCEDLTCGQLAERLQTASTEQFGAGFICNNEAAVRVIAEACARSARRSTRC